MPRKKLSDSDWRNVLRTERAKLVDLDAESDRVMVSVSGGGQSAVAAIRARDRWGDRCEYVFADTASEDEDTYRFLDDLETIIGPIVRLVQRNDDGTPMDIWDCFHKHRIISIPKAGNACKASVELKQKPLNKHAAENGLTVQAIGFVFSEPERIVKRNQLGALSGRQYVYPLLDDPLLGDCEILEHLRKSGLKPPRIYDDGFIHNNCIGAGGCVLAGLDQFAAMYQINRDAFDYAKKRETEFLAKADFTVLKDQRGGETTNYSLAELEADIESGRKFGRRWQSNCSCMSESLFSESELLNLDD